MNRLVFDITHIIEHLKRSENLTGIQRVELNVIAEATRIKGEEQVFALIQHKAKQGHTVISTKVFRESTDSLPALQRLAMQCAKYQQSYFPDKAILKKHLDCYKNRKITRSKEKISIYFSCIFNRRKLIERGLIHEVDRMALPIANPSTLQLNDLYISIGTAWDDVRRYQLMATHKSNGGRTVQMIHDLIPIVRPDLHMKLIAKPFTRWLKAIAPYTDTFVCVSKNTQKDLQKFLKSISISRPTFVAPLAHEFLGYERGGPLSSANPNHPGVRHLREGEFVICVGSIETRKNGAKLAQAWHRECLNNPSAKSKTLVFAGKPSWGIDDFKETIAKCKNDGIAIEIIENANDQDIAWLYKNAYFSVYPSLYEGWGLPIGESLWFNTPCLASNTSSMPEVGGALVHYCSPDSVESISNGLHELLDPQKNGEARQLIKNTRLRNWRDHVEDFLSIVFTR